MGVPTTPVGGLLWPALRALQIWGANTDVGKTVLSTIICVGAAHRRPREGVYYLKPVSTGPGSDSDARHVRSAYSRLHSNAIKARWFDSQTIVQYDEPVSPHIAAPNSGRVSQDHFLPGFSPVNIPGLLLTCVMSERRSFLTRTCLLPSTPLPPSTLPLFGRIMPTAAGCSARPLGVCILPARLEPPRLIFTDL